MRILIADDDLISLKMLEQGLSAHGYDVVAVPDGTQALRLLEQDDAPRLAILDWTMPGMDGIDICRRLRQIETPTPVYVILLTARAAKADMIAGLEAGANDFMTKPFDLDELRARLRVGQTVTELQAQVANRMREFQEYVESAPMGILVVRPDGSIAFANQSAHECFGYAAGELQDQVIESLVPMPLRDRHVSFRDRYFGRPERLLFTSRRMVGRRKDGTDVPVAIGLNPLSRKSEPAVACAVIDLSDLRRAERDLERFFELSPDLCTVANVQGFILRANDQFQQQLGYTHEEILSQPFMEMIHPEDVPAVRAEVEKLAAGQPVIQFRCRIRDHDGHEHWTEWSSRPVAAEGVFYSVGRDITARLQMEKDLLAREQRERAILDNTPAVIYVKGVNGQYQFVNRRFADVFGRGAEDCVGRTAPEIFPPDLARQIEESDRQVLEGRETASFQMTLRHDDGDHTYVSVKCPLFDPAGEVQGIAGIATDITEQLEARKIVDELRLARLFQRKFYPRRRAPVQGLDMAGSALPMTHMSGDYYDFIQLDTHRLAVTIGDVSGHGLGPALEMAQVRTAARLLLKQETGLSATLGELNALLCEDLPESTFVSLFLAEIDTRTRTLQYVGAGHDAFLIRADGTPIGLPATVPPLGIDPTLSGSPVPVEHIAPGDLLFLFTDGLCDANNAAGQSYGRRAAVEAVVRHRADAADVIVQNLLHAVLEFSSGTEQCDDITCVVVKSHDADGL